MESIFLTKQGKTRIWQTFECRLLQFSSEIQKQCISHWIHEQKWRTTINAMNFFLCFLCAYFILVNDIFFIQKKKKFLLFFNRLINFFSFCIILRFFKKEEINNMPWPSHRLFCVWIFQIKRQIIRCNEEKKNCAKKMPKIVQPSLTQQHRQKGDIRELYI